MIGRTITLTDTEGLAHSESNGGEKQKEDTSSEEDSEQPLPVEITSPSRKIPRMSLQSWKEILKREM